MSELQPAADEPLTEQHFRMLGLLALVVMFEGFDISLTSVVLPYIGEEFSASSAQLGRALGIIAIGTHFCVVGQSVWRIGLAESQLSFSLLSAFLLDRWQQS